MLELLLYFEKNSEIMFFRGLTLVSENMLKIKAIRATYYGKTAFKILKILFILAHFISKIKKSGIFNLLSVKYFGKLFLFPKIGKARVNYCRNYGPSNLLFCITGYNLEKLNNRQRETAVNSLVHYFES